MEQKQVKKESFLRKNWHLIVIGILLFFGMSQCTSRCSHKQNESIQSQTIDSITKQNDTLKNSLNYYTALYQMETKHNDNFTNIAVGNQNELYNKITSLESENENKQKEIENLRSQLNAIKKENKEFKEQLQNINQ